MMRPLRVLLADDDPINRELAETILRRAGHDVTCCEDGQAMLDLCRASDACFDLVLVDVSMPVMDGLTAVRALRTHAAAPSVPIIAMSASVTGTDVQEALSAGCDRHLGKPYKRQDLLAVIDGLVEPAGGA